MNRFLFLILLFAVISFGGCITQKHATVIERDPDNPCIIRMVIQIGVDGNDTDVVVIRNALEECYNKECFVPCPDNTKGCKTMINVIVKKWSDIPDDDKYSYHNVYMRDDDGEPSCASLGKANSFASWGVWRRNQPAEVYCHEVLHFLGLEDKYCSRRYNAVTNTDSVEISCVPGPDPNEGKCCTTSPEQKRCGTPCPGHDHDLMATVNVGLSCENILDVLKEQGFDKCPDECCGSSTAYQASDAIFAAPAYYYLGNSNKNNGIGITLSYTKIVTPSVGITIDAGGTTQTEKEQNFKNNTTRINITGGATWYPQKIFPKGSIFRFSTHLLGGIAIEKIKQTTSSNTYKNSETAFTANAGAALDIKIKPSLDLRAQADYIPSFFFKEIQHGFRISAGLKFNLTGKK